VILHGFMLQIYYYTTVFRVKRLNNLMLRVRLFNYLTQEPKEKNAFMLQACLTPRPDQDLNSQHQW
jgi:hypothetical protein